MGFGGWIQKKFVPNVVRGVADILTYGGNEVAGNPAGKFYNSVANPSDPNAYNREVNAQQAALAQQNIELQRDFAQNGISWRIADAARNGIAPLAALGASTPGFSPVSAMFQGDSQQGVPSLGCELLSAGIQTMSQGLGRAMFGGQSKLAQQSALQDLAYKTKQNDLLDVQIANSKLELAKNAAKPTIPDAFMPVRNRDGSISYIPTMESSMAVHAQPLGKWTWMMNNKIIPSYNEPQVGFDRQLELDWRR